MQDDSFEIIQIAWRKSKGVGAVLGAVFFRNLLSINSQLRPVIMSGLQSQHDLLLNHLLDEVVEALNDRAKLMSALTKLRGMFWFGSNGERPFDDIGSAILMTLEQVLADDFTSQISSARVAVERRLSELREAWTPGAFYETWRDSRRATAGISDSQVLEAVYTRMLKDTKNQ